MWQGNAKAKRRCANPSRGKQWPRCAEQSKGKATLSTAKAERRLAELKHGKRQGTERQRSASHRQSLAEFGKGIDKHGGEGHVSHSNGSECGKSRLRERTTNLF